MSCGSSCSPGHPPCADAGQSLSEVAVESLIHLMRPNVSLFFNKAMLPPKVRVQQVMKSCAATESVARWRWVARMPRGVSLLEAGHASGHLGGKVWTF